MSSLNGVVAVLLIGWGLWFFYLATRMPPSLNPADIGPGAFPRLVAAALTLSATLLLVDFIKRRARFKIAEIPLGVAVQMLFFLAYCLSVPRLGYYLSTALYLTAGMLASGYRRGLGLAAVLAGFGGFVFLAFELVLKVPLP